MVLVQKWPFFKLSFLGNIGQENVFYDILERKNCILGYKNTKFRKLKNCHLSKGVNPWFWSRNRDFSNFLFTQYRPGKCLLRYFQNEKTPFQTINNRSSKGQIFDIFQKGLTHAFGPKMAIFPTFFFRQYRPRKWLLRYSRTKKRLSRLKKQEVEKVDKLTFFQRG